MTYRKQIKSLGIVGGGPRCLTLLQHLCVAQAQPSATGLDITIFDRTPHLGAGQTYDPNQSTVLRMNNSVSEFNIFTPNFAALYPQVSLSYRQWIFLQRMDFEAIPPRALVGKYLAYAATVVIAKCRVKGRVFHVKQSVAAIIEEFGALLVHAGGQSYRVNQLAIASGHGASTSPVREDTPPRLSLVNSDVGETNHRDQTTNVIVEGMGLTAIDSALSLLTDVRTGATSSRDSHRAKFLRPSPNCVALSSRSDRMILPKARLTVLQNVPINKILDVGRKALLKGLKRRREPVGVFAKVVRPQVFRIADEIATRLTSRDTDCEAWLETTWPHVNFRRSIEIGKAIVANDFDGDIDAGCAAALGIVFRSLQSVINQRSDFGRFSSVDRRVYQAFCRQLEPIAFGPVAPTIDRFYQLVDQEKIVPISALSKAQIAQAIKVCGHIPGPHDGVQRGFFRTLVAQGCIAMDSATGAVVINSAGCAIRANGFVNASIGIFSRVTEHWVTGMDSLASVDHPMIARWARHLFEYDFAAERIRSATGTSMAVVL